MQYSFALAALAAVGAQAAYQVEAPPAAAASSSSAVVASSSATEAYPVASKSSSAAVSSSAPVSKSTPAATYPVVATANVTTISSQVVKYTTEVVNQYTTYCPGPTQITYGTKTYTVTAPTTLTISDCPCTISKPVFTTSAVKCSGATCTGAPAVPTSGAPVPPPTYGNATVPGVPVVPGKPTTLAPAPTGGYPTKATTPGAPVPTAGAGKVAFGGLLAAAAAVFAL
ncbi:hypothetical protein PG990_005575 [Apiospora arundinis]